MAVPALVVSAFVLREDTRVLLVRENDEPRLYSVPTGHVEPGESPQEACVRETWEETGLAIDVRHLVAVNYSKTSADDHWIDFAFSCRLRDAAERDASAPDLLEYGWFVPDDLPSPVNDVTATVLPLALADARGVVLEHVWR